MDSHVATEPRQSTENASEATTGTPVDLLPLVGDIRASRPYLLSGSPLRAGARRAISMVALAFLDIAGLALGLYLALTFRELYKGHTDPLWGVLWEAEAKWLPFLAVVTVLVFWRSGLYASRELRGGVGRIVGSLLVVAVFTLAFGLGTGHDFGTFGIFPTAIVLITALIGLLRASYESVTASALKFAGIRRRALLLGDGEHLAHLHATLGAARGGIDYEFLGAISSSPSGAPLPVPVLGRVSALPRVLAEYDVDELIVTDSDLSESELLEVVEQAHRRAVKVRVAPKTTELLTQRGEYVPGQGVPLFELRPPVFAGGDCGPLPRPPRRLRRMRVRHVQVPDDAGGRRVAPAGARGRERGRPRALQDPGRPARDVGRPAAAPVLARRGAAGAERPPRRDDARRPAPASAP
jgi:hypothetical protein